MLVYPLYSGLCPGRSIFWANREAGRGQGLPQGERGGPDLDGLFSFAQLRLSEDFAEQENNGLFAFVLIWKRETKGEDWMCVGTSEARKRKWRGWVRGGLVLAEEEW